MSVTASSENVAVVLFVLFVLLACCLAGLLDRHWNRKP